MVLVSYDISDDKLRTKFARDLSKYGFRLQYVKVYYEYGYEQMKVEVYWEDDSSCPDYSTIGLRGSFNTNFQKFTYFGGVLSWKYNDKTISIDFN